MRHLSRIILFVELILLAGPVTLYDGLGIALSIWGSVNGYSWALAVFQLLLLVTTVALGAGWYLAYVYLNRGTTELLACSWKPWTLTSGGLAVGLGALVYVVVLRHSPSIASDGGWILAACFSSGLVLALPLGHLWFERARARASNYRLERP